MGLVERLDRNGGESSVFTTLGSPPLLEPNPLQCIMNTQTPLIGEADAIKASPLFQLSLGSKELFHSNFIAWLAGKYPKQVGQLFAPYLKDNTDGLTITRIEREQKNIDVHLYFANGQELILENKVKSIPYIEQLEEYTEGHTDNQNFLLLSLTRPEFTKIEKIPVLNTFWHTMSYSELATILKTIVHETTAQYDKLILEDYIFFITFISQALGDVEVNESDFFTFYKPETDPILQLLQNIRMADVYSKIKYQSLGALVAKRLKEILPDTKIHFGAFTSKREKGIVYVSHGMLRAQGLLEVSYEIEDGLYITLQLQANRYSQLLQGYAGYGKATRQYAERLLKRREWFNFTHIGKDLKVYPMNESKMFNKYGETDFYQSVNLDESFTVSRIIDCIVRDTTSTLNL